MSEPLLLLMADVVLVLHVIFVAFVVLGLLVIYLGYFCQWQWVRHKVWRIAHLAAVGYVVVQSWLGLLGHPLQSKPEDERDGGTD
ncbi:MAG: DUF2784 family protein [Halomonas sp.]